MRPQINPAILPPDFPLAKGRRRFQRSARKLSTLLVEPLHDVERPQDRRGSPGNDDTTDDAMPPDTFPRVNRPGTAGNTIAIMPGFDAGAKTLVQPNAEISPRLPANAPHSARPVNQPRTSPQPSAGYCKPSRASPQPSAGPVNPLRASPQPSAGPVKALRASPQLSAGPVKALRASPQPSAGPATASSASAQSYGSFCNTHIHSH